MGDARTRFYLRLLYDRALRDKFLLDPERCIADSGLRPGEGAAFLAVDPGGLALDAEQRERYLMSALCRPYPLSAAALGSLPRGRDRLAAYLADEGLLSGRAERSHGFGEWLEASIPLLTRDEEVAQLIGGFLAWERALVHSAAQLREAAGAGEAIPEARPLSRAQARRGVLGLPAFFIAAQLPCPPAVLQGALDHVSPSDCWHRIASKSLSDGRMRTVARAEATPVTLVGRGVVRAMTRRIPGGLAPLVDVSHLTAELPGLRGDLLSRIAQGVRVERLPPGEQRLVEELAEAGLLVEVG